MTLARERDQRSYGRHSLMTGIAIRNGGYETSAQDIPMLFAHRLQICEKVLRLNRENHGL
jgi:hypothetical protein